MAGRVMVAESAPALIRQLRAEGFELAAHGDRLRIRPGELVTPELRDTLARHKTALLSLLTPPEFITLRGGLTLPRSVLQLVWDFERRGFSLGVTPGGDVEIQPAAALNDRDRAAIQQWRRHLAAVVHYVDEVVA